MLPANLNAQLLPRTTAQTYTSLCTAGLAAGFDKDGVAPKGLLGLGFGFMEVGQLHLHLRNVLQQTVSGLFALRCMVPVTALTSWK